MLRYMGYTIDRHALAGNKPGQVTIVSPTGKLVHAFQHSNFHEAGRTAIKWVCGLGAAREPDPDKERIDKELEFLGRIKREHKRGESGTAECPFCKAPVVWRLDRGNGHILAVCSTPDCFGVME